MYSSGEDIRLANLFGAFALHVADRVAASTAEAVGRGAHAPAALTALSRERGRSIQYLRRVIGLSHPATVRLVDRLSDDGLVQRQPGPDGRTVSPTLTRRGRVAAAASARSREQTLLRLLAPLSEADREHLTRVLELLLATEVRDTEHGDHLCRLCDLDACNRAVVCPVDRATEKTT